MTPDELIKIYAAAAARVYQERTAGNHTWSGLLGDFLREYEKTQSTPLRGVLLTGRN